MPGAILTLLLVGCPLLAELLEDVAPDPSMELIPDPGVADADLDRAVPAVTAVSVIPAPLEE
jgi:hypothetical protein